MAADERAGNGGAEREPRFANLLQPNRDMATNWSVDVGKQLESYLDELKATGLFDDGDSPLNFAEAALLIQGSIQVYSKKVEYLYNLVVRALDYLAQTKKGQEGEKPSSQEDDQDCSAADEKEEDFLNLSDEIPEEGDINVLEEEGLDSITQPMKVPTSLLGTEGDSLDASGEAGELATYYVVTCTMYRNFLLLDPSDTATVDKYLESNDKGRRKNGEDSAVPSSCAPCGASSIPGVDHKSGECAPTEDKTTSPGNLGTPGNVQSRMAEPDWEGDDDEGVMWEDPHMEDENVPSKDQGSAKEAPAASHPGVPEDDNYIDPWVPLNPHELGTLLIKPFKRGSTQRNSKSREGRSSSTFAGKRYGVFFPEFAKAWQTKERQDRARRRGDEPPNVQSSNDGEGREPSGSSVREEAYDDEMEDRDNEYAAWADIDAPDSGGNEDMDPPFGTPQEPHLPSENTAVFTPHQDSPNLEHETDAEDMSLEDLCRAHVDSILEKLAESEERSGFTVRVNTWKKKIEATVKADESRRPFDIHEYGDRLLATLSTAAETTSNEKDTEEVQESFASLVRGQPKDEVARSFSALLQLVNNGNVSIDKGSMGNGSYCFSAEHPFGVRLLSSQSRHTGMFNHMVPPVAGATGQTTASQQTRKAGPAHRLRTPVLVSCSRTPRSCSRVLSPSSTFSSGRGSRKRGHSTAGKAGPDPENTGTPQKGYTPVKLTPNRRHSKRKPLHPIQA